VPAIRTEITEIVTGLATLGYQSLDRALEIRPGHITHVNDAVFERLAAAFRDGHHDQEFALAWENGTVFALSDQGLRGRPPWLLEWKGPHRPASRSIETIPADLRIDHVFLISCKYGSEILHNSGPAQLIDHALRPAQPVKVGDWYESVAPEPYRAVWAPVHRGAGIPTDSPPSSLDRPQRAQVKRHLRACPIDTQAGIYQDFVAAVSQESAKRWDRILRSLSDQQEMLWRLLRMQAAPYYVLGASRQRRPLRYRVSTPWDFTQRYGLEGLRITPGHRGQPSVDWEATVRRLDTGHGLSVSGFVEIRWSHGKLNGPPEAKIHLLTDPHLVPGYEPLTFHEPEKPVTASLFG